MPDKSDYCEYKVVSIILDNTLVNSKLSRDLLQSVYLNDDAKNMKVPELKL